MSDCNKIINAAQKTIADRDKLIQDQTQTIIDLGIQMNAIAKDRDSDRESLSAWYHNPAILIGIGLITGSMGVLLLERK